MDKKVNETTEELRTFIETAGQTIHTSLRFKVGFIFVKVFYEVGGKDKAFCYIDVRNGDIHRAKNFNGPDPMGPRGNIYSAENGQECIRPEGIPKMQAGKPKGFKFDRVIPRPNRKKKAVPPVVHPVLIRVPDLVTEIQGKAKVFGNLPVRVWTPAED